MTQMITAGRTGGWSFRLFGIPITIHVTYLLLIALIGFDGRGFDYLGVWVAVATAGILIHELGHAAVVRAFGRSPRIDLAGLGGVTSWQPGSEEHVGRGRRLAVALAGPGAGLAAAIGAVAAGAPCCAPRLGADLAEHAVATWVYVTLWWSLLNLLPVLPLDGGQALESLLPGDRLQRRVRALGVSIGLGVLLVVVALQQGFTFAAFLVGWLTWSNVTSLQRLRQAASPAVRALQEAADASRRGDEQAALAQATAAISADGPRDVRSSAAEVVLRILLAAGRPGDALALLDGPASDLEPDPLLVAETLRRSLQADELRVRATHLAGRTTRHARAVALLLFTRLGDDGAAVDVVASGPVIDAVVADVLDELLEQRRHRLAADIGEVVLNEGIAQPRVAYLTAAALAELGRIDEAVDHLAGALRLGWDDLGALTEDERLRALRGHPAWEGLTQGRVPRRR